MKRLVSMIGILFLFQGSFSQIPEITAMEYYLDVDPGFGNGTSIPVTPATTQDLTFSVPTGSLSAGFHFLAVRSMDANGVWSHSESQPFFISQSTTEVSNEISAVEYFLDVDPGQGNGVSVAVTPATDIDLIEQIPTSALTPGFHTVYFRVQDAAGQWSAAEQRPFFISQSTAEAQNNIAGVEYFFDVDPGQGNGTPVSITPATNLDLVTLVDVSTLSVGFHSIHFRVQDESGVWSLPESQPFFITVSSSEGRNVITAIEYFFDVDPGYGNGQNLSINTGMDVDVLVPIVTNLLSPGMHSIHIRTLDDRGQWSHVESKPFYKDPTRLVGIIEYAIDTDPGIGSGIKVGYIDPINLTDANLIIPSTGLSLGSHNLITRVQDGNEAWSLTSITNFNVCDGALADFTIGSINCKDSPVFFMDISTNTASGDVYSWDFDGDGVEDNNTVGDVNFTFVTASTYEVTLTLDRLGCISSITKTITINDLPTVVAATSATAVCFGEEIVLTGSGATTYAWDNGVADKVAFIPTETITYTVTGTDSNGCENTDMIEINVGVVETPTIFTLTDNGTQGVVLSSSSSSGNQWYNDEVMIEGAIDQTLEILASGKITVQVTIDGCYSNFSEAFEVVVLDASENFNQSELGIWPNPVRTELYVQSKILTAKVVSYSIVDMGGNKVKSGKFQPSNFNAHQSIQVDDLNSGIYFIVLAAPAIIAQGKFVKR